MNPRWDKDLAGRYEAIFRLPEAPATLEARRRLLEFMLSPWPRRNQRLLEIGCSTGMFLRFFYEAGFDVTGVDSSPALLDAARERLAHRADLHLGQPDHLPFCDNEFDFVVILSLLEFSPDPKGILAEAARVARKGILVSYLSRFSLYYLARGLKRSRTQDTPLASARWLGPREVGRLLSEQTGHRPVRIRSVLAGPPMTWRRSYPWRWLNSRILPFVPGAIAAARVDFFDEPPLNPLLLWKREPHPAP